MAASGFWRLRMPSQNQLAEQYRAAQARLAARVTRDGPRLRCKDGPVFDLRELRQ